MTPRPAGNAIAAFALQRLGSLLGDPNGSPPPKAPCVRGGAVSSSGPRRMWRCSLRSRNGCIRRRSSSSAVIPQRSRNGAASCCDGMHRAGWFSPFPMRPWICRRRSPRSPRAAPPWPMSVREVSAGRRSDPSHNSLSRCAILEQCSAGRREALGRKAAVRAEGLQIAPRS